MTAKASPIRTRWYFVLGVLGLLLPSCFHPPAEGPAGTAVEVQTVGRGAIQIVWTPSRTHGEELEVRYSASPLTEETWSRARVVTGPWLPVADDGPSELRATVHGLPPVPHYVAARARRGGSSPLSPVTVVLPLRERALYGRLPKHYFGHAVALIGDINGDGYTDLLVGSPWSDEGLEARKPAYIRWTRAFLRKAGFSLHVVNSGAAYLYLGGPDGPSPSPVWTLLSRTQGEFLGATVAGLGDLNSDGYADFAVGVPGHDTELRDEGAVAVYFGRPGPLPLDPDLHLFGRSRDESFGTAITGGDFNSDGYADLVIGAPGSDLGQTNGGAVFIYDGRPSGPSPRPGSVLIGTTLDGLFGSAVAAVGDVNGDGYEDLLVGAYEGVADLEAPGGVYLYYGGRNGLHPVPRLRLRGQASGDQFGSSLAALGDVDRDGFPDFAVGARKNDKLGENAGAVYLYHGGPGGPLPEPRIILRGPGQGAQFGAALAGVGDLDGDSFADLLVGAFGAGGTEAGAVFLHLGGAGGIRKGAALTLHGHHPGAYFGRSIAGGRDLDGDEQPDFVVGSEGESARGKHAGAVFVRY